MLLLFSKKQSSSHGIVSLTLPSFLKFSKPKPIVTCPVPPSIMDTSSCSSDRRRGFHYSRESSFDSTPSSPNTTYSPSLSLFQGTIHHRRTVSRTNSNSQAPLPPPLDGFPEFFHSRVSTPHGVSPMEIDVPRGSDAERWERMLELQREFHCYNSARLEAAVEAMERGVAIEEVPIPSKICLDLLNEELEAQIEAREDGNAPR